MGKYIIKRVLQFIPVFLGVTLILFSLENIVPGDPIRLIAGDKKLDPVTENNLRASFHLIETNDDGTIKYDENGNTIETPMWERYFLYVGGLLHGDLGVSYQKSGQSVSSILADKYPYTVRLAIVAIIMEAVLGIGAGMASALKRYSFWDIFVTFLSALFVSMPAFWLGMLLQLFFGVFLKDATGGAFYLPISGAGGPYAEFQDWVYYILPAFTLAAISMAYTARIMRSQLLEVMNQDYIRTAKAKGLSRKDIVIHHALKNALIPVVTYIGMDFGGLLAGAILTETVFNWPGVGYETYRAITQRDWPLVLGSVTVIVVVVMVINLIVDVSYAFLDPRIRFGAPKNER